MTDSLVQQGLDLMMFGMGTVFVFLTVLVVVTTLMSNIINRFFPEAPAPEVAPSPAKTGGQVDSKVINVIQAALDKHRNR